MVGVVRMVVNLARTKLAFLDSIPYLFARLREDGIRDRCLEQFRQAAPGAHDKVSRYMLGANTRFLVMINRMNPDGTGMDPMLADECDSIGFIP